MINELVSYDIEEFVGEGWYEPETDGFKKWAWSKKQAFFHFPKNHTGFSLYLSGRNSGIQVSIYDLKNGLMGSYILDSSEKQIDILPLTNSVKIVVAKLWKPRRKDKRSIGIALQSIKPLETYRETPVSPPCIFNIEITTLCNMKPPCVMCDRSIPNHVLNRANLSDTIVDKLRPFLKRAQTISFTGLGEPLLCEKLFDILDIIDSKKTYTMFNSNGLLLTEDIGKKIISSRLGAIDFSVDAATSVTYGKIRNKGKFSRLKDNIKRLVILKKQKKVDYPKIIINMVLMKKNIDELPRFIELAKKVGAQSVYVKLLKDVSRGFIVKKNDFRFDYQKQILDTKSIRFKNSVLLADKKALKYGIEFKGIDREIQGLLGSGKTNIRKDGFDIVPICKKPWTDALVGIDGRVKFCCHMQPKNGKQSMILGNLNEQDFSEIWNSSLAKRFRRQFINRIFPAECQACPLYDVSKY